MKSLIFIIVLVLPTTLLSQSTISENDVKSSESVRPSFSTQPVVVRGGNAVRAMYEVKVDSTENREHFELIIYTYSYRETLRPFDDEALFTVDGLGKVFKIKNWTSRCVSNQVRSAIVISLDKEEFQSIGYAGTVGVKVGGNTFDLPYQVRHHIRQAVVKMNSDQARKMVFYNPDSKEKVIKRVDRSSDTAKKKIKKPDLKTGINELQ